MYGYGVDAWNHVANFAMVQGRIFWAYFQNKTSYHFNTIIISPQIFQVQAFERIQERSLLSIQPPPNNGLASEEEY